jgi:hypothetical protein
MTTGRARVRLVDDMIVRTDIQGGRRASLAQTNPPGGFFGLSKGAYLP